MKKDKIQLPDDWLEHLAPEFEKPYMIKLKAKLLEDKKNGKTIYPPGSLIFNAFFLTNLKDLKVVILGQDPYHGPGQAHGLCFSVPTGIKQPPSLKNIFKELKDDLGVSKNINDGNLESWAKQGIFLLNTSLTVCHGQAMSHKDIGWEQFTNEVISVISREKERVVFVLWGSHAQSKIPLIDKRHIIIKSPHPSPLSAHRGFFGSKPFSQVNQNLDQEIIW
tara:strand:- start:421 stop:1083 length:663 start_codon:yes stop_codon:yes gene_type:complete